MGHKHGHGLSGDDLLVEALAKGMRIEPESHRRVTPKATRHVYHWKHGWIPLDHTALLEKDHHAAITQVAKEHRATMGGVEYDAVTEKVAGAPHVRVITNKTTYSMQGGVPSLEGKNSAPLTDAQKREVAGYAEEVFARFPGLHRGQDQELEGVEPNDLYWAATDNTGRKHKIAVQTGLWNTSLVRDQMADWKASHGAISGQAASAKQFRRDTVIHEMGHVIHMRAQDQLGVTQKTGAARLSALTDGTGTFTYNDPINTFVNEPVTPYEMGFTAVEQGEDPAQLLREVPRWQADTLGHRSEYANASPYEFYAEAFLDGMTNGAHASESGKRAVAIADQLYGKAAA